MSNFSVSFLADSFLSSPSIINDWIWCSWTCSSYGTRSKPVWRCPSVAVFGGIIIFFIGNLSIRLDWRISQDDLILNWRLGHLWRSWSIQCPIYAHFHFFLCFYDCFIAIPEILRSVFWNWERHWLISFLIAYKSWICSCSSSTIHERSP